MDCRIFTVVTNTSKYIRPFRKIDGKPVSEVDLSNSQPFFMSLLFRDVPSLLSSTAGGTFYKDVGRFTNMDRTDSELKLAIIALLYRREVNGQKYCLKDTFKAGDVLTAMEQAFKVINKCIDDYRAANGATSLSIRMQRN